MSVAPEPPDPVTAGERGAGVVIDVGDGEARRVTDTFGEGACDGLGAVDPHPAETSETAARASAARLAFSCMSYQTIVLALY
jgi:hypothetical protein